MKRISDIVKSAVDAIWLSYDPETMQRGFEVLEQAAADGDADALCFMGRCFLGEQYVWSGGGFPENETRGENLIAESVEKGSTAGVLCAMRAGIEIENPPVSLQEAFESIKAQADEGDVFCAYMTANAYFWGDILEIYPKVAEELSSKYSRKEFEEGYNAMAYPLAVPYYEKSFEGGLSSGFGNYRSIYRSGLTDVNEQRVEKYLKRLALAGSHAVYAATSMANTSKTSSTTQKKPSVFTRWHMTKEIIFRPTISLHAMAADMVSTRISTRHSDYTRRLPKQAMPTPAFNSEISILKEEAM